MDHKPSLTIKVTGRDGRSYEYTINIDAAVYERKHVLEFVEAVVNVVDPAGV